MITRYAAATGMSLPRDSRYIADYYLLQLRDSGCRPHDSHTRCAPLRSSDEGDIRAATFHAPLRGIIDIHYLSC